MIDQRKLPGEEVYIECRTDEDVAEAIETMVIRGAPAIGVAAAFGLALGFSAVKDGRQRRRRVRPHLRPAPQDAAYGPESLLGPGADEGAFETIAKPPARRAQENA